jgi:hypothetical protein
MFDATAWGGAGEVGAASMGVGTQWTNAPHVDALGGVSYSVGVNGSWGWITGSYEFNMLGSYHGHTVGLFVGPGVMPLEFFGIVETWTPR